MPGGRPFVPLDAEAPPARLRDLVVRSGVGSVIMDGAMPTPGHLGAVAILDDRVSLPEKPLDVALEAESEVAYVMFTSGTTGLPKAVVIPRSAVAHFIASEQARCPFVETDRVSQFYDLTFDPCLFDIFLTLSAGAALHVVPAAARMAPGRFIAGEALTVWSSVPSVGAFMQRAGQLKPNAFPELRLTMFCGEALPLAVTAAWRRAAPNGRIDNQYGPTEATVIAAAQWVDDPPELTPGRAMISIGHPLPDMTFAAVDERGAFVPAGTQGELAIHGPQLALGYDDAALTARRFPTLEHPVLGSSRWYLTGDLGYVEASGRLHVLGRVDNQVKVQGRRVELEEIEAQLRAIAAIDGAVVSWSKGGAGAEILVAFLVDGPWLEADVVTALHAVLPGYMVPRRLVRVPSLPTTANGKLDRKALRKRLDDGA